MYSNDLKLIGICEISEQIKQNQEDINRMVERCRNNGMELNTKNETY